MSHTRRKELSLNDTLPKNRIKCPFVDGVLGYLWNSAGDLITAILALSGTKTDNFQINSLFLFIYQCVGHFRYVIVRLFFFFAVGCCQKSSCSDDPLKILLKSKSINHLFLKNFEIKINPSVEKVEKAINQS
jgi:hypothetical protein